MKVLMFGWEFPPHISGGLGTACAGLTGALGKTEVEVLFTIPKLQGGEHARSTTFISASTIPIRQHITPEGKAIKNTGSPASIGQEPAHRHIVTRKDGRQTILEVPSKLVAYNNPVQSTSSTLQDWNYSFGWTDKRAPRSNLKDKGDQVFFAPRRMKTEYISAPFRFSGTYGPNLLEEVERYAQAAAEITCMHEFDVIHAHDWMTFPAGIAAKKLSGKPLMVHVHATEIDRSGALVHPKVFAIEKEGMHFADKVVTVSNWTRNIAVEHYGVDEKKIEVVHNGIAAQTGRRDASASFPLKVPIVTFLGRITHQKGPMYFVEAARKVHEKFPDVHFIVAGSGDQLPTMIERIAQIRLSEYFHFTGFLKGEDVDRIWAMSNVYVMPSVSEPFGIAPLEAIQAGVPVIISKQAGVSEVMPHAIKVDFWNSDALAEAICSVIRFKSLANTLKQNGVEEVRNITWDKAAKKLTTLYYELSSQHAKPKKPGALLSGTSAQKITNPAVF